MQSLCLRLFERRHRLLRHVLKEFQNSFFLDWNRRRLGGDRMLAFPVTAFSTPVKSFIWGGIHFAIAFTSICCMSSAKF